MALAEIVSTSGGTLVVKLDQASHGPSAVCAAALGFIDRAWVLVDATDDAWVVVMTAKEGASGEELSSLGAELERRVRDQELREQIRAANRTLSDEIRERTFEAEWGGADVDDDLEELDDLDDLDFLDDPLGIATPWEERAGADDEATKEGSGEGGSGEGDPAEGS